MVIRRKAGGFTLAEILITLVIIGFVGALGIPMLGQTKLKKPVEIKAAHGTIECFWRSGHLYQWEADNRNNKNGILKEVNDACYFSAPTANFFVVQAVGAGAGGYELHEEVEDFTEGKDFSMSLSEVSSACDVEGNGITCPPNALLREALKNAPFVVSTVSPSAKQGHSVTETYVGVGSPRITRGVDCWAPTAYTCTKTHTVKKDTGEKDEEGKPIYEEVEEEYQTTCYTTQAEDNALDLYTCSEINSAISAIAASISSQRTCGSNDWCYTLANENFIAPYKQQVEWFNGTISGFDSPGLIATGVGAPGGQGIEMSVSGKIDFCDHHGLNAGKNGCPHGNTRDDRYIKDEDVRQYLSRLFTSYYLAGTTDYMTSCLFGNNEYEEFPDTEIDSHSYKRGAKGEEPRFYGAIKTWEKCVTNVDFPTGGEGGWIRVNDSSIYGSNKNGSVERGKDATNALIGYSEGPYVVKKGYIPQSIPTLSVHTELSGRIHTVGQGGGAAKDPVIRYVTQLDDDCYFDVALNGPKIQEGVTAEMIEKLEEQLDTHLTCNDGTLNITAEGGFYNPYPYTKTYHGFDLINSDGSKISIIHSLTTSDPGGISPYIPHDVFSKILLEDNNFGAGGRGDEITDFCTMPQGEYRVKSLYGESVYRDIRRTIDRTTHEQSSCDKSNIRRNYASAGGRGVIIISW